MLVREARAVAQEGILVGFHGYMENASIQMERLEAIPGSSAWTLVSIQGLHRFYRGRTEDIVASWMTREDREEAIADNVGYVSAALDHVPRDEREIASLTIAVSDARMRELKAELEAFRHKLAERYQVDPRAERVVQLNFQLFPLSKKKG